MIVKDVEVVGIFLNHGSESEMRGDEYDFKNGKCWYWYKEILF